jgi:hypothetical protein
MVAQSDVPILQSELRLLRHEIRASGLQERIFGDDTVAAVKDQPPRGQAVSRHLTMRRSLQWQTVQTT